MKACKSLSLFLALLMLLSCLVVVPAAAKEEKEIPTIVWEFDVESIENGTQGKETDQYLLDTKGNQIVEKDGEKCFSVNKNILTIKDKNNDLVRQTTFYVDFDIKFDAFPSGMHDATYTVDEYPMALFTWVVHKEDGRNPVYDRSIRIDSKGNLFYTRNTGHSMNASLKLGTWNNFRFAITPESGGFEVHLNGERIFYKSYQSINDQSVAGSYFRFFEGLPFQAYLKNIKIRSMDTVLGINQEPSADYLGYQTTAIKEDGTFDIRFVSSLAKMNTSAAGYQIISILTDSDGEVFEDCQDTHSHFVYDKITADGKEVTSSSLNTGYLTLETLKDIPADIKNGIFVIRPYIRDESLVRVYGKANILYFDGKIENGYPVLSTESLAQATEIEASDDTYVRDQKGSKFGSDAEMQLKNSSSGYNRQMYVRFDIPEQSVDSLLASDHINLRLKLKSTRAASTTDEIENGGVLVNVYATSANWDEGMLTHETSSEVVDIKQIGTMRLAGSGHVTLDVTDYLHEALLEGETAISLRFENAVDDGSNSQTMFYSKEAGSDAAPMLMMDAPAYHHNLDNFTKIQNYGYEPWGYAETIVREWINKTYNEIYSTDDNREVFELEKLDISKPVGSNTVLVEGKNSPNPPSNPFKNYYARNIDSMIENGGFVEDSANFCEFDEFGGITNSGIKGEVTGYFHTEMIDGRAYLINPLGNPTYLVGLGQMQLGQTDNHKAVSIEKYGSEEGFWEGITKELRDVGVNMSNGAIIQTTSTSTPMIALGGLSGIQSYMSKLGLVVSEGVAPVYKYDNILNAFDPDFLPYVLETNKGTLEKNVDNIYLIGYTSDNELTSDEYLLDKYLTTDSDAYHNAFSYAVAWTFLIERTGKINPSLADVTPELRKEFKSLVFSKILGAVRQAIDTYSPNHLYLGNRTDAGNKSSEAYLRVAGYYCDMLSINMYDGIQPSVATMAAIYRYSGKPFFVTEFYSKADDAIDMNGQKLANQQNAGFHVKDQQDRANYYENYTTLLLECKYCVGWTWFTFRDNDQSLYYPSQSDTSKILRVWQKGANKDIVSFIDENGNIIQATGNEYRFYTGCDFDMSSIGSNKGLLDNHLNFYPELTASFVRISDNLINIIRYFDNLHK
jgi:hypothetical protein